ncbi:MAG TPA: tetratricopeptide repeat protein [Candidatus Angelobacter sp.]|nr:tetratricopeptide repeat protein [Candidatus Angelobacter sp.]
MSNPRCSALKKLALFCALLALPFAALRADTPAAPQDANISSNETLRAYLQLQGQLHDTMLAIERNRQEAQAAAAQDATALSNRLAAIEQSLVTQRAGELAETQNTNHLLLTAISAFAVFGLAAALFAIYFQSRAVGRLADISTALTNFRGLPIPSSSPLGLLEHDGLGNGSVEQSNARLVALVQHLEKRIAELEHTATLPLKEPSAPTLREDDAQPSFAFDPIATEKAERITKLLEQGQSHLSAEHPEQALAVFDEILLLHPNHPEALVKKGSAFEKLRQPQDALECYDRAIAADGTLTIAYLHKGGLCSRLEKYGEAMECYERALHTQEKKRAA